MRLREHHYISSTTALKSLEIACDTLLSGKAKVMIAGGFDDISEEGSHEFANVQAAISAETEFAMGCELTEMYRLTATPPHLFFSPRSSQLSFIPVHYCHRNLGPGAA